ncbi:HNH endonuclease [Bacteroides sp. KH569_7]|uniref:HNH endonuclease n=1 Tax=Bacteroides muris (ex Fokt et al. 2023) TaxID=2937417 RepID=A0A9X2SXN8_9BACE|nr:HNH endonuclease signature motif containing protein [Bacteroides muris (ex Fokt et al. 2023)]MCR6509310.1 HNH endonuclease [Bacteroides muris (ex Fokt et al. 2023)]
MGLFDFFHKKNDENKKHQAQSSKLPSDAQIRAVASIGLKSDWNTGRTNENLFPMAFEWIETGQYTKKLRFKTLRSESINYAPELRKFCDQNFFFYDGEWYSNKITLDCGSIGNVFIKYPGKCMVELIADFVEFDVNNPNATLQQAEDYSDILEIDCSPEAIQHGEKLHKELLLKEKEEREREEIEAIKSKIREKKRKQDIEKAALQELMDEGEIFPEANKRPPIPKEVVDAVWNRDGGKCVYCGSTENLHLDHIIPFSKGGDTSVENLQLLCQKCNLQKSNKIG